MTYAAGFRTEHGIYLTVDSASTGGTETAIHSDTFFGEQAVHDTYAITDNAMKLFTISTHRLVAAAGDSQAIYQSIYSSVPHNTASKIWVRNGLY